MRKTLSVLAIIAALSSSALATSSATLTGGSIQQLGDFNFYIGDGNVTIADGAPINLSVVYGKVGEAGADVSGATINMTGGTLDCVVLGGEAGGTGSSISNTVSISGGILNANVAGGSSKAGNSASNTVTISGGAVTGDVFGGSSINGNANNNTVTISGGAVTGDVMGGNNTNGNANGNTVIISGGAFEDATIYGAKAPQGSAEGNTVTISGGTFTNTTVVVANMQTAPEAMPPKFNILNLVGKDGTLGNLTGSEFTLGELQGVSGAGYAQLNVYGKGITVGSVGDFTNVLFHLPAGLQSGDAILTLAGSGSTFISTGINVVCSGATQLTTGDTVTLVKANGGATGFMLSNVQVVKGVTASYSGTLSTETNYDIVLTIGDEVATTNDEALKSMTETRTDVAALVNSAADFMATTGVQQAKLAAKVAALAGKDGAAPFMAMGGSSMRYNTGSHVDANGFNGALGVAKAFDDITLGIAGEYGLSSYRSHVGSTSAKGDSKLYGGALLADWQDKQGWHAEGAVRLGRTSTDYSAMTALGHTHYTDHASYQGALIGGGKEFKVSRKSDDTVDLYARYMYTHTNASNTTATSGESMHFAGVDSHRTMVGARYNHDLTDTAVVYAGAAWMHEFNGDAHSVIGGFTSPSPSLEGDSGMVEIGTTFAPCRSESILLNLNVQGWTGVQRGISGGAGCTIKF